MRYCKVLFMLGILVAVAAPVGAVSVTMNMRDFDAGTLYFVSDGTYTQAQLHALPTSDPGGGGNWRQLPVGGLLSGVQSDSWGIFRVENIQDTHGNYIYQGGPGQEITALYWGGQDTYLKQTTAVVNGVTIVTQDIHANGLQAAFFLDTTPDWATAVNAGEPGWTVVAGKPTYAGITDGTLIWTMDSTSGQMQNFPTEQFFETFFSSAATYGSNGNLLLDMGAVAGWGTGTQNADLDTNSIAGWNATGTLQNKMVDISLAFSGTNDSNNPGGLASTAWTVRTSDPMEADLLAVPEPVTMAGLLLGVGCLGRYIKKRR